MDLEDMIAQTQYPFIGLEVLLNHIQNVMAENYYQFHKHKLEELYDHLMGLVVVSIAMVMFLHNLREEFRDDFNKRH